MQAELDREKAQLLLPGMQRPYFIEYRLDDFATYEAVANYGALAREESGHQRVVRVTVRIGDYTTDSSSNRGEGSVALAATDDNAEAIRYALWTATDEAYKSALRAYSSKQAALKRFENAPAEDDFAHAKPAVHIGPLVVLDIDRAAWKQHIVDASGLYASDPEVRALAPDVQYSSANLRALAVNRYLVNSEGTVVREGYTGYAANISVGGQAADGMQLSRDNGTVATTAKELESWPAFRQRVIDDIKSLEALRNAPVVSSEDYHGPVLFSGDAATDVMDRLFIPNVQADRPEMGTTARTQGVYTSSFHARVLPEFLSATDDPLMASFDGHGLLGAYAVDDEGVPAQAVDVVTNGKLENYLIGRTPVKDFPESNGHGRAAVAQAPRAHSGVMIFKSSAPLSSAEINARLVAMAKEQGRDVYAVETLGGELAPRLLYLVHPDGTRQLVRGAVFDELDNRSLRSDILAAGDDLYLANSLGTVPSTTIAPSLLFDDIGVKRATEEQQKLPYYGPPESDASAVSHVTQVAPPETSTVTLLKAVIEATRIDFIDGKPSVADGTGTITNDKGETVASGRLINNEGTVTIQGNKGASFIYTPQPTATPSLPKWPVAVPTNPAIVDFDGKNKWTLEDDQFLFLMDIGGNFSANILMDSSLLLSSSISFPEGAYSMWGYSIKVGAGGGGVIFKQGSPVDGDNVTIELPAKERLAFPRKTR
jgi:predicted Zn-dependent protease